MALRSALVDRARVTSREGTGQRVGGKTIMGPSSGPWFRQWYEDDFRRPLRRSPVLRATRYELTTLPGFSLDFVPRWAESGSLADLLAT